MHDAEMRRLFQQLRNEEVAGCEFRVAIRTTRNTQHATWWRGLAFAMIALVAIALGTVVIHRPRPATTESIVTWKAPTDFLLRTPGSELLSAIPQIPERK